MDQAFSSLNDNKYPQQNTHFHTDYILEKPLIPAPLQNMLHDYEFISSESEVVIALAVVPLLNR